MGSGSILAGDDAREKRTRLVAQPSDVPPRPRREDDAKKGTDLDGRTLTFMRDGPASHPKTRIFGA
jgi:hypothetical protein